MTSYDFSSQMKTLAVVRAFHRTHGHSPTYQELATLRGMSEHAVYRHVYQLTKRGYLKKGVPGAWRQIFLSGAA